MLISAGFNTSIPTLDVLHDENAIAKINSIGSSFFMVQFFFNNMQKLYLLKFKIQGTNDK